MKHLFTTIVALITLLTMTHAQYTQRTGIKGNEYKLTGEVTGAVSLPPNCGYSAFATVIEFKIVSFNDATYKAKEIGLIVTCPEFYGEGFWKVGSKYEVQLADECQDELKYVIMGKELLDKYPLDYQPYAVSAKKIDTVQK